MESQEIRKAKLEGYTKATEDFVQKGKLNLETYILELQLPKIEDNKKPNWWDKNFQVVFQAITAGLVAIIVALFGWQTSCRQNSQKDTEIAIKKVETIKELIPVLTDKDSEKRRYAFSSALLLYSSSDDIKDKESLFSFGETAYSLLDAEALEAVIKKIRNFETLNGKRKNLNKKI